MTAEAVGTHAVRLHVRSAVALAVTSAFGVVAFGWPLITDPDGTPHAGDAPFLMVALLLLMLAVVLAEIADGGIDAKAIAMLGVLAGSAAALRMVGGGVAGFEPLFFLLVPAGRVLGRGFGFVLGALALFASALLTGGVGPWLPFQMLAAGWVGFGAGCLPRARGRAELLLLAGYIAVAALLYGLLLNLYLWPFVTSTGSSVSFVPGDPLADNLGRWFAFTAATSLGFDIPRAILNAVLVLAAGRPILLALRRAARRAAFDVPVTFGEAR